MRSEDTGIGGNEKAKLVKKPNKPELRCTLLTIHVSELLRKTHYSFELHFK